LALLAFFWESVKSVKTAIFGLCLGGFLLDFSKKIEDFSLLEKIPLKSALFLRKSALLTFASQV